MLTVSSGFSDFIAYVASVINCYEMRAGLALDVVEK